jgi:hypothetical protein
MNWADWLLKGFAVFGAAAFTYQVGKHGFGWVWSKMSSWGTAAKVDLQQLALRVQAIEQHPALIVPPLKPVSPAAPTPPKAA